MKKFVWLLVLLLIPNVLAITSDIGNRTFQPSETIVIELFGNIIEPIAKEDIELKRNNVQVPWEYDVKRLDNKWFISGILPSNENNYTLIINDVETTENGQGATIDYNETIIVAGELIDYSIKPGFYESKDEMTFDIFLYEDFSEEITIDFPEERNFVLNPGENELVIQFSGVTPGLVRINVGRYNIPVLILPSEDNEPEKNFPKVIIVPVSLERIVFVEEEASYSFVITNNKNETIDGLIIDYNDEVFFLEPSDVNSLDPGESFEFVLRPKSHSLEIEEVIYLRYGDEFIAVPVHLEFTENRNETSGSGSGSSRFYCSELGGKICTAGDVCSGESVSAIDTPSCCVGQCVIPDETASYAWIGWIIGIIILIVLVIVAGRYMKTRKPKLKSDSSISSLRRP